MGVQAAPLENNVMAWPAIIFGPDDTPWEGGTFKLLLEFTEEYPNKAPKVKFISKIFHPHVYGDGKICLDILQNQWSPIYDIAAVLTSIQSLLSDPNPASPANAEASQLYERDKREYNKRVRAVVEASWMDEGVAEFEEEVQAAVSASHGAAIDAASSSSSSSSSASSSSSSLSISSSSASGGDLSSSSSSSSSAIPPTPSVETRVEDAVEMGGIGELSSSLPLPPAIDPSGGGGLAGTSLA